MKKTLFTGLSSLLLPLGIYGVPTQAAAGYQRSYVGAGINVASSHGSVDALTQAREASVRDAVIGDELEIISAMPVNELVIIDAAVPDKHILYRGIKPGVEVVELDANTAGLAQLTKLLAQYKNLSALHLVSHAEEGVLLLGNSRISADVLRQEVELFSALNGSMNDGADLLFYGCNLAKGDSGAGLLDLIQANTQLNIAASDDLTGNSEINGDWDLEIQRGEVTTASAFSAKALADFSGVLAPTTYRPADFAYAYATPSITTPDNRIVISGLEGGVTNFDTAGTYGAMTAVDTSGGYGSFDYIGARLQFASNAAFTSTFELHELKLCVDSGPPGTPSVDLVITGYNSANNSIGSTNVTVTTARCFSDNLNATQTLDLSATFGSNYDLRRFVISYNGTPPSDRYFVFKSVTLDDIKAPDATPPTVSSINRVTSALTNATSVNYTVTFSESVTGVGTSDFTLTASGTASGTIASVTPVSASTYTVAVNNISGAGTLRLDLNNAGTGIADTAGNAITTGFTSGQIYTIDQVAPAAPSTPNLTPASDSGLSSTDDITNDTTPTFLGITEASAVVTVISSLSGTLGTTTANGAGNWLFTAGATAPGTHTITATATDAAGNVSVASSGLVITIDTTAPTAFIVVADTALSIGETSLVTITFSEAVTGFTNADLTLANGTLSAVSSSDGGITWTATFTPMASVTDASNIITLDNTGVTDVAGNAGSGSTNSNNYAIDTARPTASIVVADTALRIGETSLVTFTFSEAVTGFTNADLTIANGTLSAVSSSDGGITWTATFTPTASTTDATNLITLDNTGVSDAAGNTGTGTTDSNNYAIDTVRPTATIVVADTNLSAGETSLVTITFSEAVTGFSNADLIIANGTLSAVSSSDGGITWTATLTPAVSTTDASNVITLDNTGVADTAGNVGTGTTESNNYAVATAAPSVTSVTILESNGTYNIGDTVTVSVAFNEQVSVSTGTIQLTLETGATDRVISYISGSGSTSLNFSYTVQEGDNSPDLDYLSTSALLANGDTIRSNTFVDAILTLPAPGAANSLGANKAIVIDGVRPTASIVVADTALTVGETSIVTFTFSEAVSGFTTADLTVANGVLSGLSSSDGGITWTATLTPITDISDTTNLITLDNTGVQDAAGNTGSGATSSNNYTIDTQRPAASIVVADSSLVIGDSSLVTITFNEVVTGFTNADLTIANGSLSAVSSSDGGITWTATLTPSASVEDATNLISLNNTGVADLAGNAGTGITDSNNYAIDTLRPTAALVVADTALAAGETSLVTITFSEAVTGFTNADLTFANGSLSAVSSSDGGITWTATFTPTASVTDATNIITLDNTGVTDVAGNAGTGSTNSNNYAIDTARPTASIVVATTDLIEGETSAVTITFSETVSGFDNADLTIENATLTAVSSSDGGITWTATLTAGVGVNDSTNVITLNNTGVIDAAGNTGTGTTDSNNYAVSMANSAAVLGGVNGGETYIENGTAVVIDADMTVSDADLDALNVGAGNYSGAAIIVGRNGGPVATDFIGFIAGNGISQSGTSLLKNGLAIATVDSSVSGQLMITFTDANSEIPTRADAIAVLRQLTYSSSNNDPAASVNLDISFNDGVLNTAGIASVTITPVNDAPTLTATAGTPTFIENSTAVDLFSGVTVSTVEAAQTIIALQLTVTNVNNGSSEILTIDGLDVELTQGNTLTTVTNALGVSIALVGTTATVTINNATGISPTAAQTVVEGMAYRNTDENPNPLSRVVTLTSIQDNGGVANNGVDTAALAVAATVTITPVNNAPTISGTPATMVNQNALYGFTPAAADVDSGTLTFSIVNQPAWTSFDTATGALSGVPSQANVGVTTNIVISVSDGTTTTSLPAFSLTVVDVNDAPTITGTPNTTVNQDATYSFTPTATDVDADTTLVYSITNQPSWADFDTETGALTGTPTNANVGTSTGIVISVSDGALSASLPAFDLTVVNVNDAPTISGTPITSLEQDVAYSFIPTAADVDADTELTFSIVNKPEWAAFDPATGALTGTPEYADGGITSGIVISVTDGLLSASLPAFDLEVIQTIDPMLPIVSAPEGLAINATGLYTRVSLRQLLGLNASATQEQVDAILATMASDGISGDTCCISSVGGLNASGSLLLRPGRHELTWSATNAADVTGEATQIVDVNPLVSLSKSQLAVRGNTVAFRVLLNGDAPEYPFSAAYVIDAATSAGSTEHNLVNGTVTFTEAGQLQVEVPVQLANLTGLSDSQLVVNLAGEINKGASQSHTISIRSGNVAPTVALTLMQDGANTTQVLASGGPVTVTALVTDQNTADTHSYNWAASDSALADTDGNPVNSTLVFNPAGLSGRHQVTLNVTDSAGAAVSSQLYFRVVPSLPVLALDTDTDNDGIDDQTEGLGDDNGNGIPNYLDNMPSSNILPQVGTVTDSFLLECDPGVRCGLGRFALVGGSGGAQILNDEIGTGREIPSDPGFDPVGGIFDFSINDLPTLGQSVRVVIPQRAAIPADAVYRKFKNGAWVSFISNANNGIQSAQGELGYCPPPGSSEWVPGLTQGHLCVELTIEDGGPNDDDGLVNGAVADPGAVSSLKPFVEPPPPPPKPDVALKTKGGGSLGLVCLLLLGGLVVLNRVNGKRQGVLALALLISSASSQALTDGNAYVRIDVYAVEGDVTEQELAQSMSDAGHALSIDYYDVDRRGYQFALGYQWHDYTYTELGFLDLGDVQVNMTVDGDTDFGSFTKDLAKQYPVSASGWTAVQGLTLLADQPVNFSLEAGAYFWQDEKTTSERQVNMLSNSGVAPLAGLRMDIDLTKNLSLGFNGRRIYIESETIDLYSISGRYRF